jgi:hypothetical protein
MGSRRVPVASKRVLMSHLRVPVRTRRVTMRYVVCCRTPLTGMGQRFQGRGDAINNEDTPVRA